MEYMKQKQKELTQAEPKTATQMANAVKDKSLKPGECPKCGAMNDPEAMFCENCGAALRESVCPHCGMPIDPSCDFCESCKTYLADDRCSFCSAPLTEQDTFCPECGSPRDGIECPVCHTKNKFAFCSLCGTPLTDSAFAAKEKIWKVPFLHQLRDLEQEIEEMWLTVPASNPKQRRLREKNQDLRNRVLQLLEEDGEVIYEKKREPKPVYDEAELLDLIEQKKIELQRLLDKMEMPEQESPAQARIMCMACKPSVSRLGWKCNYKNALHTSPLGCACPQKGGKWIVLGNDMTDKVQDDK